ncbi:MAG: hypothetical protein P8O22_03165 [Akkermansiaceae bacterium]|nr:hypothetical protein [Akkermansiaceae bacterium]
MKVPPAPNTQEPIVIVQKNPSTGVIQSSAAGSVGSMLDNHSGSKNFLRGQGQLERGYPWLLAVSTLLSTVLCWLYVTKPVVIDEINVLPSARSDLNMNTQLPHETSHKQIVGVTTPLRLVPSDSELPSARNRSSEAMPGAPIEVDPRKLTMAKRANSTRSVSNGWEKTNLKVQHILSADVGMTENEKIIINVPVLYQTRSMRWTPEQMVKARDVLERLMLYERDLSKLRKEGLDIMTSWNHIIRDTIPAGSLRADSPSLPYNHGDAKDPALLPGSASAIQVEDK